jgi:hypothetical protein
MNAPLAQTWKDGRHDSKRRAGLFARIRGVGGERHARLLPSIRLRELQHALDSVLEGPALH